MSRRARQVAVQPSLPVARLLAGLDAAYPAEICHLSWRRDEPWTLLFAVILSAQCTDERVNRVTPQLFKRLPRLADFAPSARSEIERLIYPTGFFRAKADHLIGAAVRLLSHFGGVLPDNLADLVTLPGVGRKTANVVLWTVFQKNEGMVVDTHIGRISRRQGLAHSHSPDAVERELMQALPRQRWGSVGQQLVQFGRDVCRARAPQCPLCPFGDACPRHGL